MKRSLLFLLLAILTTGAWAQSNDGPWTDRQTGDLDLAPAITTQSFATDYRLVELTPGTMTADLLSTHKSTRTVTLPTPNGKTLTLTLRPVSVMAPGLAARYPGIQTYTIVPDGDRVLGGRLDWTYQGLHATVRTPEGTVYVDPYALNDTRYYVSYYVEANIDNALWSSFVCGTTGETSLDIEEIYADPEVLEQQDKTTTGGPSLVQRRYRLAMAATGEFSTFHGGTVESSLSAVVTIVNRVNEVFGRDLAIQLELIETNDQLIFLNPSTDPYVNQTDEMLNDNPGVLDEFVGNSAYDIGHVISTGPGVGQGVANLEGVCNDALKGRATSTRAIPQADPFIINILCHEMGHQFGGTHVQSGCQNVQPETAVEPGGGTTIMGYAGICPAGFNIQTNSDDYYNQTSLQQMFNFSRLENGDDCAEKIDEGNTIPDITEEYENGFYIPISTPFELTAEGTDAEEENLTYCWEQRDINTTYEYDEELGQIGPFPGSPVGNSPIFRSFSPTESPTRVFPSLEKIINNTTDVSEVLPTYSRDMNFRCAVRDNHPTSGGVAWSGVTFLATEDAGPFLVTLPNASDDTWNVGDYTEVTWDVANTDGALVNCQRVNIRLSTDGGFTYPITLLENTYNDGSAFVTVPNIETTDARVRIEAADNIFFDISNNDFTIAPAEVPGFSLSFTPFNQTVCSPAENGIINFVTMSLLDYDSTITLEVTSELPPGVVAEFNDNPLEPGESTGLILDFSASTYSGLLNVEVRASTTDGTETFRNFELVVFNSNFSALAPLTPEDGTIGIGLSATFSWVPLPNALSYDFQLSTSPAFSGEVLDFAMDLGAATYASTALLESNTLYFWRVRAVNECGPGEWTEISTFHTGAVTCEGETAADTPITIPGSGPLPVITSAITVDFQGEISDLNIPFVNVRYQPIQNFQITIRSPSGTEVMVYDGDCFTVDRVNVGFDDDAPQALTCPLDVLGVYQPVNPLSAFIGESTEGQWEMTVTVTETGFGTPGSIDGWAIEFCASSSPDNPVIVRNEEFCVPPSMGSSINETFLAVEDDTQGPFDLEYTLVTAPTAGELYFLDELIGVGDIFRQSSLDAGNVFYLNTDATVEEDGFTFVVTDGTGGYLATTPFIIDILEGCVVSTGELGTAEAFRLYPNPTEGQVALEWGAATSQDQQLRVYNLQGRLLREARVPQGTLQQNLDLSNLPAGVFLIQIGGHVERVIVE